MTIEDIETPSPVTFIEQTIKVAGFPLVLNTKAEQFVRRLHSEQFLVHHDFDRQEGKTTAINAFVLFEALTQPNQEILLIERSAYWAREHIFYIMRMYESISDSRAKIPVVSKDKTGILFANGSRIVSDAPNLDRLLRGKTYTRIIIENFNQLPEEVQADFALSYLPPIRARGTKIAIL